jgi:hypothetical protein
LPNADAADDDHEQSRVRPTIASSSSLARGGAA